MAVGASKPTVAADKDGFFSVKNKMLVSHNLRLLLLRSCFVFFQIPSILLIFSEEYCYACNEFVYLAACL